MEASLSAILWSIWKKRNDKAFTRSSKSLEEVEAFVFVQIGKWLLRRSQGL